MPGEDYNALWRASAYEAVPYTDDFPEALLVFPEIIDGSIGQGNATKVTIDITISDANTGTIKVTDNGSGFRNPTRFLAWAASEASDNIHRNGHGMKKAMTKFEKEYTKANWYVLYRRANRDPIRISGPFKGSETSQEDIPDDEVSLMPSGTEWGMQYHPRVLGEAGGKPHK